MSRFSHRLKKWAVLTALNDCTISMLARLHQSTIAGLQRLARTKGGGVGLRRLLKRFLDGKQVPKRGDSVRVVLRNLKATLIGEGVP